MNLREVYTEAIKQEFESLSLLIEFLVFEKKVLSWESDYKDLDLYFKPNNRKRMNQLLIEFREETK